MQEAALEDWRGKLWIRLPHSALNREKRHWIIAIADSGGLAVLGDFQEIQSKNIKAAPGRG